MTILVTGSTGTVGSFVTQNLAAAGASVRALTRSPDTARFPAGVDVAKGDLGDLQSMRAALREVRTLFLLDAVTPDELARSLATIGLAREAGVERFVYLSVIHADRFTDVPHFASKYAAERMFDEQGLAATLLRPGYYMQNDTRLKDSLIARGVYGVPIGSAGTPAVDVRDLAAVATRVLLQRDKSDELPPVEILDVVAPEPITGEGAAALWSELLDRPVTYGGDDLDAFERQLGLVAPAWMAYDMRRMMGRFQRDGLAARPGTGPRLTQLIGLFVESGGSRSSSVTTRQWRRDAKRKKAANAIHGADGVGGHEAEFA